MPRHVAPMLAVPGDLPTDHARWAFEVKWDGVRAVAYIRNGHLTLESRNLGGHHRGYPELAGLGLTIAQRHALILDAEVVAFDEAGRACASPLAPCRGPRWRWAPSR
jgi:bifunctional non-homologous end joining protein LigD